jgi:hypothetical protein
VPSQQLQGQIIINNSNNNNIIIIVMLRAGRSQVRVPMCSLNVVNLRNPSSDGLCGLVVRVPGYRFRGPGFDSRR